MANPKTELFDNESRLRKVIRQNIEHYMEERGLTRIKLAKILGLQRATLDHWFNARTTIKVDTIDPLCEALGITPVELITDWQTQDQNDVNRRAVVAVYDTLGDEGKTAIRDLCFALAPHFPKAEDN